MSFIKIKKGQKTFSSPAIPHNPGGEKKRKKEEPLYIFASRKEWDYINLFKPGGKKGTVDFAVSAWKEKRSDSEIIQAFCEEKRKKQSRGPPVW